ncbi:Anaphase-promoting complex subunit 10, variant 2 [Balamuthia mandrillaris]
MATGSGAARQELFKAITEETNTGLDGGCFEAEAKRGLVEVGEDAVWSLSSAKPGFGVTQLRDNNVETYWQSDGGQPHTITMQWQRRRCVEQISFYVNYTMDESYTPHTLSIRVGTTFHDLREIKVIELEGEPSGWINVPLLDETTHRFFSASLLLCSYLLVLLRITK